MAAEWELPAADFLMSENRTPGPSPARSPAHTPLRSRGPQLRDKAHRGRSAVDSSDDETILVHTGGPLKLIRELYAVRCSCQINAFFYLSGCLGGYVAHKAAIVCMGCPNLFMR